MVRLRDAGRFSNRLNSLREAIGASAVLERLRGRPRADQARCHSVLIQSLENRVLLSALPAPITTYDQSITGDTTNGTNYNSPAIAYDPNNQADLVEAASSGTGIQAAYSINAGATWTAITMPAVLNDPNTSNPSLKYAVISDVSVGFDLYGRAFISYSEHNADNSDGEIVLQGFTFPAGGPPGSLSLYNNAGSLTAVTNVDVYQWANGVDEAYTPNMAVDANQSSYSDPLTAATVSDPFAHNTNSPLGQSSYSSGNIYIAWATKDTLGSGGIDPDRAVMAVSSNGGLSFSAPMEENVTGTPQVPSDGPSANDTSAEVSTPKIVISQGTEDGIVPPGQVTLAWQTLDVGTAQDTLTASTATPGDSDTFSATGTPITLNAADPQLFDYYTGVSTQDPTFPTNGDTAAYPVQSGISVTSGNKTATATGDFNGDNVTDLAVLDKNTGTVKIYLGNDDGTFTAGPTLTGLTDALAISTGDYDGDNKTDVMVIDSGGFEVYSGNGDGTFAAEQNWSGSGPDLGNSGAVWNVVSAKIDGDSLYDMAITDSGDNALYVAQSAYVPANNGAQIPQLDTSSDMELLNTGLAANVAITTISLSGPLSVAIANNSTITLNYIYNGNPASQTFTLSHAAAKGTTTLQVTSTTLGNAIPSGTTVDGPTPPVFAFNVADYALQGTSPNALVLQTLNDNRLDAVVGDGDAHGDVEVFQGSLLSVNGPTDKDFQVGAPVIGIPSPITDLTGDGKVDITALTQLSGGKGGVSVLIGSGTTNYVLSSTNPSYTETAGAITSGVFAKIGNLNSSTDSLALTDAAGFVDVLQVKTASSTAVTFESAATTTDPLSYVFPTSANAATDNPVSMIDYTGGDADHLYDLLVFDQGSGKMVEYSVPTATAQTTIPRTTDIDYGVNITDPNFTDISNLAIQLAMTDAHMEQIEIQLLDPVNDETYTLLLNQDVGTNPGSEELVAGTSQGITGTNGLGFLSNGSQGNFGFDMQATRDISEGSGSQNYTGYYRPEVDPNNLNILDDLNGTPGSAQTGKWVVRFTAYQNIPTNPAPQTLSTENLVFTSGAIATSTTTIAINNVVNSLSGTNFQLTVPADPTDGVGPGLSLAADNTLGPYDEYSGNIYLAVTTLDTGSDTNILLYTYSGETGMWNVQPVNDDTGSNSQFLPAVAVDPTNGTVVVTWYDARDDGSNMRVARYIATSIDGGESFSNQSDSYLNESNDVYDAITGAAVNLGPIPDNISSGNTIANGHPSAGFGDSEGLAVVAGHVYAVWAGNQNGGTTGTRDLDILTSNTTYADGPRVIASTQGVVSTSSDIVNPAVDNAPALQYIDITFDRPITPDDPTYMFDDVADFPDYFDPAALTIYYRDDNTPGTAPPTSILSSADIISIQPLNYGYFGASQQVADATEFRIALGIPQEGGGYLPITAPGTYSYSITEPAADPDAITDGYYFTGIGNFQAPYSVSASSADTANLTVGLDTNLAVPAPASDETESTIAIPSTVPAADTAADGAVIVDINVTVDLDGASDGLSVLDVFLEDPNGNVIPLSLARVGASQTTADVGTNSTIGGNGLISTVFDDSAATPVAFGNYEFSGTFKPDTSDGVIDVADGGAQGLAAFYGDTLKVNDPWTLVILSDQTNNGTTKVGLLRDWSLQFTTGSFGSYTSGNPMDQNADAITGQVPTPLVAFSGSAVTAPGSIGDAYVTPNPTSSNSYTADPGGNYFAGPYDDSTLPLIIPGPQLLSTRDYPALNITSANDTVPAATDANTPGTLMSQIVIGGDSDVSISDLTVDLNMSAVSNLGSLVIQLIYTPAGGGDSIPITLVDEEPLTTTAFGASVAGDNVPLIFTDNGTTSIQLDTNSLISFGADSFLAGFYQPATPLSALDGQTLKGTYELVISNYDTTTGNTATLNSWSINATTTISAVDPNSGAGVNSVDVYFSQAMNPTSVENAAVTLMGPTGPVTGETYTITLDGQYDPNYPDSENREYKISFSTPLTLTGGYSLVIGSSTTANGEPESATGVLLDSNADDGLTILRDQAPSSSDDRQIQVTATNIGQTITEHNSSDGIVQSTLQVGGVGGNTLTDVTDPANPTTVTGEAQDFFVSGLTVTLQLNYPRATELSVILIAPDGTAVQLFSNLSSTGKLVSGDTITFSDSASVSITTGAAPFFGTFSPQEPLSYFDGTLATGIWTLQVKDNGANTGTVVKWSLEFTAYNPDSATAEPGDDATVGMTVFNMGASNAQSHETWNPIGGSSNSSSSASASGPVTTIAVDPADPTGNTVYVGAATGGVWETTDFLTTDLNGPTYFPLTNFLGTDSSNIGSIAVLGSQTDPATGATVPSEIFAGTGELYDPVTGAADNAPGMGILISLDGGQTWKVSDDNGTFDGLIANKVLVDPNLQADGDAIVYVAFTDPQFAAGSKTTDDGGVYSSTDSGQTWTLLKTGQASDLVFEQNSGVGAFEQGVSNPTHNLNDLVAAFEGSGVYFSPDRGAIWNPLLGTTGDTLILNNNQPVTVGASSTPNGNDGRIVLATPALTGNPVEDLLYQGWIYAAVVSNAAPGSFTGSVLGLYMTKDYGQTWTKVSINYDVAEGAGIPAGTGNYALALAIDPTDPNVVYLASSGYSNYGGGMIRVDTTGISDAHSFYQGESGSSEDGGLRVNTRDVAETTLNQGAYSNPIAEPTINLLQNPSEPFVTNATIDVSDITEFANTGTGASWIPFDGNFDFTNTTNPIPVLSFYHTIVTEVDPLTGDSRLILGTEQGVFTGVDDDGTYLTVDPTSQQPVGATSDASLSQTPLGSRNGNLQIAEFYYGAVQPSQNAADIAGSLFYGNAEGAGLTSSTSDILSTGDTTWSASDVPSSGFGVATDPSGSGAVYQYADPGESGYYTNFFQVNGVGRTSGLITANDTGVMSTNDSEWADLSDTGNGSLGYNFAVNPLNGDQIVISSGSGEVYSTQDQGEHWSLISSTTGLDGSNAATLAYVLSLNQSANGNFIYAGTLDGHLYVTFTGGGGGTNSNWIDITIPKLAPGNYVEAIAADPVPGSYDVYAVTQQGVYYLSNAYDLANGIKDSTGKVPAWTAITSNLPKLSGTPSTSPNFLTTMTADLRYANPVLYVGADSGVYRGVENGTTWTWTLFPDVATDGAPADGGYLPDVQVTDLDLATGNVDPTTGLPHTASGDPDALVASTFGRGAYAIRLAPIVSNTATAVPAGSPSYEKIVTTGSSSYITNDPTLTISGSSEKAITGFNNALISIYLINPDGSQGMFLGGYNPANPTGLNSASLTNTADQYGNFNITLSTARPSANGDYTIGVQATDNAGVVGAFSEMTVALEVTPPAITSLGITPATDLGSSSSDGITKNATPVVTGQGAAGAAVTIFVTDNATSDVETYTGITADADGNFLFTLPAQADGTYTLSASEVDSFGNMGSVYTDPTYLTIITSVATPAAPATGTSPTTNPQPTFTGSGPGSNIAGVMVTITPQGGTATSYPATSDASGNYTFQAPTLADGIYSVTATQTDIAGNVSAISPATTVIVDTTAPDVLPITPINTSQFGTFSGAVATFTDANPTGGLASATIEWGDGNVTAGTIVYANGAWEVTGTNAYQTAGTYNPIVSVEDAAGNIGDDSADPGSIIVGPPAITVTPDTAYVKASASSTTFTGVIASFGSGVVGEDPDNFSVSIDWGDGTAADVFTPGDFDITASHTYAGTTTATQHSYLVSVTVTSTDGSATPGSANSTVAITPGVDFVQAASVAVASTTEGTPLTPAPTPVADITSNDVLLPSDFASEFSAGDFTATINWGDGTQANPDVTAGTIVTDGNGGYYVEGTHTYPDGGANAGTTYPITTTIKVDDATLSPSPSTSALVTNANPTVNSVTGPAFSLAGQVASFQLNVTDPGTTDTAHGFTYLVSWGDGKFSTLSATANNGDTTITHTYTTAGSYPVSVTAYDKDDGVGVNGTTINVAQLVAGPTPSAVNEGSSTGQIEVAAINGDTATPTLMTFPVTVGWGDGSSDSNVMFVQSGNNYLIEDSHTYADGSVAGTSHTITVTYTPVGGTATSVTDTILVKNVAPALVAAIPTQELLGQSVNVPLSVSDAGTADDAAGFSFVIDWGDGSTPTSIAATANNGNTQSATHTYTAAGDYPVNIYADDKDGAESNIVSSDIEVAGLAPNNISAAEGSPFSGVVATISDVSNAYSASDFTATINWGDGTPATAGTVSAGSGGQLTVSGSHTFADGPATDNVITTITFDSATEQSTGTATISDVAPTAYISGPTFALAGQTVNFAVSGTDPGTVDTADGFSYLVNFGDGTSQMLTAYAGNAAGEIVSHTYATTGAYAASVIATDKDGVSSAPASVADAIAVAGISAPAFAGISESSTFTGTVANITNAAAYSAGSFAANINWGDGTSSTGTVQVDPNNAGGFIVTGSHAYGDGPANDTISVTVTTGGLSLRASGAIAINNVAPTVALAAPVGGFVSQSLPLTITATDASAADAAAGFTYQINWGDGTTQTIAASANNGSGVTPTHTYTSLGTYNVTVTATDKDGGTSAAATTSFAIVANPQIQNFSYNSGTVSFTLPQTSAPISSLDASDFALVLDGQQNVSLANAPITFDPNTGAVSIDTSGLNLAAGDYQLYTLPGTGILPQTFSVDTSGTPIRTKVIKLNPGKKINAPTLKFPKFTIGSAPEGPILLALENVSKKGQSLTVDQLAFLSSGPYSFAVQGQTYGASTYTIAAGGILYVKVYYTPTVAGTSKISLRSEFNDGAVLDYGWVIAKFTATAVNPKLKSSITKKILKGG